METAGLVAGVRAGETRAVARAISLVEDSRPEARALLAALFPHAGRSLVVGVTGPPGAAAGGRVLNADVTLICERPKIRPHRDAMRARIADLLQIPLHRVSVKATTTEGMGFTGREEGLMAQAVVTIESPP